MAIIDALNRFSQNQAITTTAVSTNVIDLGAPRDIGPGEFPLQIQCYVTTGFAGGTSLQVQAQGSVDNSTWTTYVESAAIVTAALTAGAKLLAISWPHRGPGAALPRYIRLNYVVVGTMTAGAVTSDLVLTRRDATTYPTSLTVTV